MSAAFHEELSRILEAPSPTAASAAWDLLQAALDHFSPDWTATFRTVCRATHPVHLPWTIAIDTPTNGRLHPMNGRHGTTSASPPLGPTLGQLLHHGQERPLKPPQLLLRQSHLW